MSVRRSLIVLLVTSSIVLGSGAGPQAGAAPQGTAQWMPAGRELDPPSPPAGSAGESEGSGVALVTAPPPMGREFVITARNNAQYEAAVAYNWKHKEYLVVWQDGAVGSSIHAQRVSSLGALRGPPMELAAGTLREPAAAYDPVNDRYLVVWMDYVSDAVHDWDLSGRFVPWNGPSPSLPAFKIAHWPGSEYHPELDYARGQELKLEFLVVFGHHPTTGPYYIAGIRVYADGSGFAPASLAISAGPENREFPDVTYNQHDNKYVVVWNVWRGTKWDVEGVRLHGNGSPAGGEFVIANSSAHDFWPSVAACHTANQYLVVWNTEDAMGIDEIRGRSIDSDGIPAPTHIELDATEGVEIGAEVACNADAYQYLVVWQEKDKWAGSKFGILGSRVDTSGNVLDAPALEIVPPILAPADRFNPAVAAGPPPSYLVAWEHVREGTSYQDIHGRIIGNHARYVPLVLRNRW